MEEEYADERWRRRRRHYRQSEESGTDAPGIVSLIFGCIAVVCLLMGCFTCGMSYFAAGPLAIAGVITGFFARGGLKVAGLTLNLVALAPAIILMVLFLLGMGVQAVSPIGR
jgi:hypothetical protein